MLVDAFGRFLKDNGAEKAGDYIIDGGYKFQNTTTDTANSIADYSIFRKVTASIIDWNEIDKNANPLFAPGGAGYDLLYITGGFFVGSYGSKILSSLKKGVSILKEDTIKKVKKYLEKMQDALRKGKSNTYNHWWEKLKDEIGDKVDEMPPKLTKKSPTKDSHPSSNQGIAESKNKANGVEKKNQDIVDKFKDNVDNANTTKKTNEKNKTANKSNKNNKAKTTGKKKTDNTKGKKKTDSTKGKKKTTDSTKGKKKTDSTKGKKKTDSTKEKKKTDNTKGKKKTDNTKGKKKTENTKGKKKTDNTKGKKKTDNTTKKNKKAKDVEKKNQDIVNKFKDNVDNANTTEKLNEMKNKKNKIKTTNNLKKSIAEQTRYKLNLVKDILADKIGKKVKCDNIIKELKESKKNLSNADKKIVDNKIKWLEKWKNKAGNIYVNIDKDGYIKPLNKNGHCDWQLLAPNNGAVEGSRVRVNSLGDGINVVDRSGRDTGCFFRRSFRSL